MKRDRLVLLILVFAVVSCGIGIINAAIPNNTLRNNWLVITGVNVTGSYEMDGTEIIDADRNGYLANLTLTGPYLNGYNVTTIGEQSLYPQQDYSYLIWVDGANYYAKNGTTGNIDYSGIVYADVWQQAHDALTTGGHILQKEGLYTLTKTLNMSNQGIWFSGETMWRGGDGTYSGIKLANTMDIDMMYISGRKCEISELFFDGNRDQQTSGNIIDTINDAALDLHMAHCYLFYGEETGLSLDGGAGYFDSVYIEYCLTGAKVSGARNSFDGCGFWGNYGTGVLDDNPDAYSNQYDGCQFNTNQDGIKFDGGYGKSVTNSYFQGNTRYQIWLYGSSHAKVEGNTIYGTAAGGPGIYLNTKVAAHSTYNVINNNNIYNNAGTDPAWCIRLVDANQDYNVITGNVVTNFTSAAIVAAGANNLIRNNIGFTGIGDTRWNAGNYESWNSTHWIIIGP